MQQHIIRKEQFKKTTWEFGESTELFIYPSTADYSKRHFSWRVSTATVNVEKSTFSALYGVKRWIMPLDGNMHLTHKNQGKMLYEIQMKPYQAHCFKGDWDTESQGKVRDFNLMLKEGAYGILKTYGLSECATRTFEELIPEAFDARGPMDDVLHMIGIYSIEDGFRYENHVIDSESLLLIGFTWEERELVKAVTLQSLSDDTNRLIIFSVSYEEAGNV